MDYDNNIKAAIEAGQNLGHAQALKTGGEFVVIPEGSHVHEFEEHLDKPRRLKQVVTLNTLAAFVAYMNTHKTANSAIFADVESTLIRGIVDYHAKDNTPAFTEHVALYKAPVSEEWKRWGSINGKAMSQVEFALFIEENQPDIVNPPGADILELAKRLEAKKKVTFKQGHRLDNGDHEVEYSDETTGSAAGPGGKIEIPKEITLGIPVFYGGPKYEVRAFFRYRINEGRLTMWVDLHRTKMIRDDAFNMLAADLGSLGLPVYEGKPSGFRDE